MKSLSEYFDGVLLRDFWAAYDAVMARDPSRRPALGPGAPPAGAGADRPAQRISKGAGLREEAEGLIGDAHAGPRGLRPGAVPQPDSPDRRSAPSAGAARVGRWSRRADRERLYRHQDSLFTFLDYPEIPRENNLAERMIRPVVIIRKNSQGNRSEHGAAVQAILTTMFQTFERRGHDPIETVVAALRDSVRTGSLPELPR